MITEQLLMRVVPPVVALLIGYMLAALLARRALAESQRQWVEVQTQYKQMDERFSDLSNTHSQVSEQLRSIELEQQKLQTQYEAQLGRKEELEQALLTAEEKVAINLSAQHQSEKEREFSQAELQQVKKQQQDLQSRLQTMSDELLAERESISQLKTHNAELGKQCKGFEIQSQQTRQQLDESKELLVNREDKLEQLRRRLDTMSTQYAELKTSLDERDAGHVKQLENFEEQKQVLQKVFENTANKIFDKKGKDFSETNKLSIDGMLKPFRDQIDSFQKRVNDIHDESIKGNTTLNSEIKKVLDIGLKMSDEASNLTSALKGDSQQRGAWGEAQLERTLEMSGLIEDAHYEKQSSFKDQAGKQKYTDYLIKLPDSKHIIIDSKVSLVAYDKAVSATTPEEEALALDEHVKSVKTTIDDLASKDYTNLIGIRSPSFVLMFIPIEPAYIDALKNKKDLFSYGYEKGIVLVSHTTLIPILRTVANLWMMERSNVEAREISDKAGDIFNQVCVVAERLQKLGSTLGTVSNHYNSTVKALVGQQGLHGKVERFNQLSSKVSKTMPSLEPTHLDFEIERLDLIAEPLVESEPLLNGSDDAEVRSEETIVLSEKQQLESQEDQ